MVALALDKEYFDAFSSLRVHLEVGFWDEAVALLEPEDHAHLRALVRSAFNKLHQARVQIPYPEHRDLHLTIYSRLDNPFVTGLLAAYWDGYEFVELNTYADYSYLKRVWQYHERIVEAICQREYGLGKQLLIEHMGLLSSRGISVETRVNPLAHANPA
jgi:DNA-binding GntR family transcriptional regulator